MSSESANPNPSSGGGAAGLRRRSGRGRTFRPRHRLSKPKISAGETPADHEADERPAADLPVVPDSEPTADSAPERSAPPARPQPSRGEPTRSSPRSDGPRRERSRGRRAEPRPYAAEPAEASEERRSAEAEAEAQAEPPSFEAGDEPAPEFEAQEGFEEGAPLEDTLSDEAPAADRPETPDRPLPGTVEALAYRPASPRSVEEAVLEVKRIVDSLQRALHDMEEVLELIEDAEQQKVADEREVARLQELLRQMTQVRDRLPMVAPVVRRREGYESRGAPAPAPSSGGGHPSYASSGGGDDRQGGRRRRRGRGGRGGRGDVREGGRGERGDRGDRGERGEPRGERHDRGDRGDRGDRAAVRPAGPPEGESGSPYEAPPEASASFESEPRYSSEGGAAESAYSDDRQPEPPRLNTPPDAGPEV